MYQSEESRSNVTKNLNVGPHARQGLRYLVCECVCLSVCPFVCCNVFRGYAQRDIQIAIPAGLLLHRLHFFI